MESPPDIEGLPARGEAACCGFPVAKAPTPATRSRQRSLDYGVI